MLAKTEAPNPSGVALDSSLVYIDAEKKLGVLSTISLPDLCKVLENHGYRLIGQGTYNRVYHTPDRQRVIKVVLDASELSELPERAVRLWNIINPKLPKAEVVSYTPPIWSCPYQGPNPASNHQINQALLTIFETTGRIVVDAICFRNFIQASQDSIVCVDVSMALLLIDDEEHAAEIVNPSQGKRKKSIDSLESWVGIKPEMAPFFAAQIGSRREKTVLLIKALVMMQEAHLEVSESLDLLKKSRLMEADDFNSSALTGAYFYIAKDLCLQFLKQYLFLQEASAYVGRLPAQTMFGRKSSEEELSQIRIHELTQLIKAIESLDCEKLFPEAFICSQVYPKAALVIQLVLLMKKAHLTVPELLQLFKAEKLLDAKTHEEMKGSVFSVVKSLCKKPLDEYIRARASMDSDRQYTLFGQATELARRKMEEARRLIYAIEYSDSYEELNNCFASSSQIYRRLEPESSSGELSFAMLRAEMTCAQGAEIVGPESSQKIESLLDEFDSSIK